MVSSPFPTTRPTTRKIGFEHALMCSGSIPKFIGRSGRDRAPKLIYLFLLEK
jgi:hypothetical protein